MSEQNKDLNTAQVGKMFVTSVNFTYCEASRTYNDKTNKYDEHPAHWNISATLSDKPCRYDSNNQQMSFNVEQEIGNKLVEVLLPVIVRDASQKAQQLADDSKAMLVALGERTLKCITDMPASPVE